MRSSYHLQRLVFIIATSIVLPVSAMVMIYLFLGYFPEDKTIFFDLRIELATTAIIGVAIGLVVGLIEVFILKEKFRRMSFKQMIILKSLIYLILIGIAVFVGDIFFVESYTGQGFGLEVLKEAGQEALTRGSIFSFILHGATIISVLLFLDINEKFGQGVLKDFVLGKYHIPKQEERIFMFIDLKSSTTWAEKLGHVLYSQLIQDCFYDLTDVIIRHNAEIYQYVGDEVVLKWRTNKIKKKDIFIGAFFNYQETLNSKADYYQKKYGIAPVFKAGVNMGTVTVAEVGEIKKEIAYHGDVLNTAARIQAKCNEYEKMLMVSEDVYNFLGDSLTYQVQHVGELALKGKVELVNIYSIEK